MLLEKVIGAPLSAASGPGTVFSIVIGSICVFAGYAGSSLSYGANHHCLAGLKGFMFGIWVGFSPFAFYAMFKWMLTHD